MIQKDVVAQEGVLHAHRRLFPEADEGSAPAPGRQKIKSSHACIEFYSLHALPSHWIPFSIMGPGSGTTLKDFMRSRKIRSYEYALIPAACFSYVHITEPAGLKASSSAVRAMISMLQNTMCLALSYRHDPDADEIFKILEKSFKSE